MTYPECEKLLAAKEQIQQLQDFIKYATVHGCEICSLVKYDSHPGMRWTVVVPRQIDEIIYGFFDISPDLLEEERRSMLADIKEGWQP